jgi:hypothetical protein
VILKWIFKKLRANMWSGLNWLRRFHCGAVVKKVKNLRIPSNTRNYLAL